MPSITIKDVAQLANVSVGTASMALNNNARVSQKTKTKVFAAAKQLNYQPNCYAKSLASQKSNMIGLIVTDITNPFFGILIDKIQTELNLQGYEIVLGISNGSITKEKSIVKKFISLQVDGVICVPSHKATPDRSHYDNLNSANIPFCFVTSYCEGISANCVMTDLSDGSYQITKHLLSTGHRNIVYIAGPRSIPVSHLRITGYLTAFLEFGMTPFDSFILEENMTFEGGYHATQRILKDIQPDAIITANDFMAMGVLKCLHDMGLEVPKDISVAGYDDVFYTTLLDTPLTTVHQPIEQICQRVVQLILQQIKTPEQLPEKILLKPQLIVRDSFKPRK